MSDKTSYSDDSDVRAYLNGLNDAVSYDACDPEIRGYEGEQYASYIDGYGDGMDINIKDEFGVCPERLRQ